MGNIDNVKYRYYCKKLRGYRSFVRCMLKKYIRVSEVGNYYVPQGVCIVDNYILITFYDYTKVNNSVVSVIDFNTKKERVVYLDGKYHCGGIAYDDRTKSIYITGEGGLSGGKVSYVNKYDYEDFITKDKVYTKVRFKVDDSNVLKSSISGKSSVAYLTVYDSEIYLGNFTDGVNGKVKRYNLDDRGNLIIDSCIVFDNPYKYTQGICKYQYEGEYYYFFSTSYGRLNDSWLYISKMDEDNNFKLIKKVKMPVMAEQINVNKLGEVYIIFESGAKRYNLAKNRISDVCFLGLDELLL